MANWIYFLILLLSTFATSLQEEGTTAEYDYDDDYYDNPEPAIDLNRKEDLTTIRSKIFNNINKIAAASPKIVKVSDREEHTTEKQFARYEVTELVIDVPNTDTKRPILTNFTVTRPLNYAGVPINKVDISTTNLKDEGDEAINTIFASDQPKVSTINVDKNAKGRNIKFDVKDNRGDLDDFYPNPKSVLDDQSDEDDDDFFNFGFKDEPKSKSFRDYFYDIEKGISYGFDSVTNNQKDIDHSLHKFVSGPISFLSKLHKKSSELAKKIHNAVSRHKVYDDFDDSFFR